MQCFYANPTIYIFPREKSLIFPSISKWDVDSTPLTMNNILSSYDDSENLKFKINDVGFKNIEEKIYIDLADEIDNNKLKLTRCISIGILKKIDDKYYYNNNFKDSLDVEVSCKISDSHYTCYLENISNHSYKITNKSDPSKPLLIHPSYDGKTSLTNIYIIIEVDKNHIASTELEIKARHKGDSKWKYTEKFKIYRNNQTKLDDFKLSKSDKDSDFFVLPRVKPDKNQKNCIKQLQIINNQVFARNASLTDFQFVTEDGTILQTITNNGTTTTIETAEIMAENARNALNAFEYDSETDSGCKSGNKIGKLETHYSYNFSNFGQQKDLINYLHNEYFISTDTLEGRIYDRNFLFGNYKDGDPDSKIEGIVNLYTKVVCNFISNTLIEANKYVDFPNRWLSCPKFNPNYHRGNFTTTNSNKYLYSSITNNATGQTIYTNWSQLTGYNGSNNLLPYGTTVQFVVGRDKYAYKTNETHCYEISHIKFPGQNSFQSVPQQLWIQLSDAEKQECHDDEFNENFCNYIGDNRVNIYNNNGVPYFISGTYQTTSEIYGGKHTYNDFLNMSNSGHSWYGYSPRPSMNDPTGIGLDCSGLVTNCICDCNEFNEFIITDNQRRNGISVSNFKNDICRSIIKSDSPYNGLLQNGDVIISIFGDARHIVLCNEGNVNNNFSNTYTPQTNIDTADVQVIHNYGAINDDESNFVKTDTSDNAEIITNGCFMKTLRGPYKHTGIKLKNTDNNISSNITLGRIYLWKKN